MIGARWIYLLTPAEAAAALAEYNRYHAYGPPYADSPNINILKRRDSAIRDALIERSKGERL